MLDVLDAFVGEIHLDGEPHRVSDLTYGEHRKMRQFMRELAPNNDEEEAGQSDVIPALIAVIRQRTDPGFTLEQALEYRPADVAPPTAPATGRKKAAAK